jgi:hypothetical protein
MSASPKRRRFRFGLRGLIILMTVVALYFASWWPTKTRGVADLMQRYRERGTSLSDFVRYGQHHGEAVAVAPLVLSDLFIRRRRSAGSKELVEITRYYLWFAGWIAELPITTERVTPVPPKRRGRGPAQL